MSGSPVFIDDFLSWDALYLFSDENLHHQPDCYEDKRTIGAVLPEISNLQLFEYRRLRLAR